MFFSIQEMLIVAARLRRCCSKCTNPQNFLTAIDRECFFWYVDVNPEDSDDDASDVAGYKYTRLHLCQTLEEVVSHAEVLMACTTIADRLKELLRQLRATGCQSAVQLICYGDYEDTAVWTRRVGFKISNKKHYCAVFDISWEYNSPADRWDTFVAGHMKGLFFMEMLESFLGGGTVFVQGEYCTRRKSQTPFSWKDARRLVLETGSKVSAHRLN